MLELFARSSYFSFPLLCAILLSAQSSRAVSSPVPFPAFDAAPALAGQVPHAPKKFQVSAEGSGDFHSIQNAIDAAPASGGALIMIAPGVYREVLTIDKPSIHLRSANRDASKTVVVNDRSSGANGGTLHSATVNVTGDNFLAEDITFENDFNRTHPQLPAGSQALALLVTGDRAIFHNVRLLGNQDTVYAGSRNCSPDGPGCIPARQYFSDCYIAGNVDFIFGDGKAAFDHCEIHSTPHSGGFVTAQAKHYADEDSGFVFDHCKLTADKDVTGKVYLGRPWRPFASVVFLNTEMDEQIDAVGWREWHPGETHSLDTAFYAEYNSTGPGAHPGERDPHARLLTPGTARQFEPALFLRGGDQWNPLALLSSAPRQVEPTQSDGQNLQISGIAHIALRVSDLDRERKFLQSLGFEEAFAQTQGASTTEAFFKVNDRQFIELYPMTNSASRLGLMHICYESDSLPELSALYVARGLSLSAVKKGGAGNLMSSFHDPLGQEIEFTQYLPGSRHFEDRGKHLGSLRISDELQGIELAVSDLPKAKKFYTADLGFEEWKWKGIRGTRLRISRGADQWIGLNGTDAEARPQFMFRIPNVKRAANQLGNTGFKAKVHNRSVSILDPDGNVFIFSEDQPRIDTNDSKSTH
ncbi:MAG TPA: pectinesterase family protein [Terracidiphilus sp.]|jgi:pectin methylesterase-like acyl-CoA thioesterase/catechol 2,3-dioxygenase-like lactoylglutathione lyase family enzyme